MIKSTSLKMVKVTKEMSADSVFAKKKQTLVCLTMQNLHEREKQTLDWTPEFRSPRTGTLATQAILDLPGGLIDQWYFSIEAFLHRKL